MRFDIPEQKKLVHEMLMPIRWGEVAMRQPILIHSVADPTPAGVALGGCEARRLRAKPCSGALRSE